jgi:hypothetical protein
MLNIKQKPYKQLGLSLNYNPQIVRAFYSKQISVNCRNLNSLGVT